MICIKCKKELTSNMVFCPFCGSKVNTSSSTIHSHQSDYTNLFLYGHKIDTSPNRRYYSKIIGEYIELSNKGYFNFKKIFDRHHSPSDILKSCEQDYLFILKEGLDYSLKLLAQQSLYHYDEGDFLLRCDKHLNDFNKVMNDFVRDYQSIVDDKRLALQLVENQKSNRAQFVGGGYGMSGALKGILIAGAANTVSSAMASLSASMKSSEVNSTYSHKIKALMCSGYDEKFAQAVCNDVFAMFYVYKNILLEEDSTKYKYPFDNFSESDSIFKRLVSGAIQEPDAKEALIKAINQKPFDQRIVKYAYEKYGDDNGNLDLFLKCFNNKLNIQSLKIQKENEILHTNRMSKYFGVKENSIRKRFLTYSPYITAIEEHIGDDFEQFYDEIVKLIPIKIKPFCQIKCWKKIDTLSNEFLNKCNCSFSDNEIPLIIIDIKDLWETGTLIITNKGFYRCRGFGNKTWDTVAEEMIDYEHRGSEYLGMPDKYMLDVNHIWELFCLIFSITKAYDYNNLAKTLDCSSEKKATSEIIELSESDFIDYIKSAISQEIVGKCSTLFIVDFDEETLKRLEDECQALRFKKSIALYKEKGIDAYENYGILITDIGLYFIKKNKSSFVPYTIIDRIYRKDFMGIPYITICGNEFTVENKNNADGVIEILESFIIYYKKNEKNTYPLKDLRYVSAHIWELSLGEEIKKIWYSQDVGNNILERLSNANRTFASISFKRNDYREQLINEDFKIHIEDEIYLGLCTTFYGELLITDKGVFIHESDGSKRQYTFSEIEKIDCQYDENGGITVIINYCKIYLSKINRKKDADTLCWFINLIVSSKSNFKPPQKYSLPVPYEKYVVYNEAKNLPQPEKSVTSSSCFITTAVCKSFDKPDNCYELNAFRKFRDNWLKYQPNGNLLIQEYYRVAPTIVKCIEKHPNRKNIYLSIWNNYLSKCLLHIEKNEYLECKNLYIEMVNNLKEEFFTSL